MLCHKFLSIKLMKSRITNKLWSVHVTQCTDTHMAVQVFESAYPDPGAPNKYGAWIHKCAG